MLEFDWLCQHSGRRNKNLAHLTRRIFPSLSPRMRTTRKNTDGLRDSTRPIGTRLSKNKPRFQASRIPRSVRVLIMRMRKRQTFEAAYKKHEDEKKRTYGQRILEIEHGVFTPLVLSTSGGMGREAQTFYKRLADLLSLKRDVP